MTIDCIVVSVTLTIENDNYSETPPEVAASKGFLVIESLAHKYLTLSLQLLAGQIDQTVVWGQKKFGK